jgi:hypothetical protein
VTAAIVSTRPRAARVPRARLGLAVAVAVLVTAGVADAYPQFQLMRDQTCTGCHIAPSGGGLLNENGLAAAESMSQFGTAPEFMYGKVPTPEWLILGGDFRGAGGLLVTPESYVYAFPMQAEIYARATFGSISFHLTGGFRSLQTESVVSAQNPDQRDLVRRGLPLWSREHYVTWRQNPDENEGLYIRAGRFMPVFGLRFAEHPMYTRRYGGTQLYSDTYSLAVEYVTNQYEVHATAFVEDFLIDPVEHATGGALYTEYRTSETMAVGVQGMFKNFSNGDDLGSSEMKEFRVGLIHKMYLPGPEVLLQTEVQFVNQLVGKVDRSPASRVGGAPKGFVGNLVVSKMLRDFLLLDVGLGHFDSNYRIANLDRDCVDVNLHWFTTSHLELVLNTRYELIGFGKGGDAGGYALLQVHYRL